VAIPMPFLAPCRDVSADMIPDNPGVWMYHCHVNDHMIEGMSARYQVLPETALTSKDFTSPKPVPSVPAPLPRTNVVGSQKSAATQRQAGN